MATKGPDAGLSMAELTNFAFSAWVFNFLYGACTSEGSDSKSLSNFLFLSLFYHWSLQAQLESNWLRDDNANANAIGQLEANGRRWEIA